MTFRQWVKYGLFGKCPGFRGKFRYCGTRVYFPPGSIVFRMACADGLYESDNQRLLGSLVRPGSCLFDVGANIGLMAIPVLRWVEDSRVVSFEPSPTVLPCLRRTVAGSGFGGRWALVEKAVGARVGSVGFALSTGAESAFEGIRPTGRAKTVGQAEVPLTTLDAEWERLGRPEVSAIKIDIEGADIDAIRGATGLIVAQHPAILVEWYAPNLAAFGIEPGALFDIAGDLDYRLYAMPHLVRIETAGELRLHMVHTDTFLLHGP
ncbi:MAG: FkbM family methyltransferase [Verrucomicrobiae bacterium]|nr:FkbM family methyltransferase [Verrucomicrobiae bacterium]